MNTGLEQEGDVVALISVLRQLGVKLTLDRDTLRLRWTPRTL